MNELSKSVDTLTTEILILKQQTAQNIIEIGKRLIQVKESLGHGEWLPWLGQKVEFSDQQARRLMKVANECSNSTTLLNLPPSKVFALLDLPSEQRESFIENNPIDQMSTTLPITTEAHGNKGLSPNNYYYKSRVDIDLIRKYSEGLMCGSARDMP